MSSCATSYKAYATTCSGRAAQLGCARSGGRFLSSRQVSPNRHCEQRISLAPARLALPPARSHVFRNAAAWASESRICNEQFCSLWRAWRRSARFVIKIRRRFSKSALIDSDGARQASETGSGPGMGNFYFPEKIPGSICEVKIKTNQITF